ncbi:MAG TPA: Maf family protein [Nevskiaceae bacterium]
MERLQVDAALREMLPILASTSRYRLELLKRVARDWETCDSAVDEAHRRGELPAARATRLAEEKARAVARRFPARWILGADQVCSCRGEILDKPGSAERARAQLRALSGATAEFHTAVALVRAEPASRRCAMDHTVVRFRALTDAEIARYVAAEPALDCAGGFKCEGLGITLCDAIETTDPTALIGLPLIAVRRLLAQVGVPLP